MTHVVVLRSIPGANGPARGSAPGGDGARAAHWHCPTCGRKLAITWPTRSVLCGCGARIERPLLGRVAAAG